MGFIENLKSCKESFIQGVKGCGEAIQSFSLYKVEQATDKHVMTYTIEFFLNLNKLWKEKEYVRFKSTIEKSCQILEPTALFFECVSVLDNGLFVLKEGLPIARKWFAGQGINDHDYMRAAECVNRSLKMIYSGINILPRLPGGYKLDDSLRRAFKIAFFFSIFAKGSQFFKYRQDLQEILKVSDSKLVLPQVPDAQGHDKGNDLNWNNYMTIVVKHRGLIRTEKHRMEVSVFEKSLNSNGKDKLGKIRINMMKEDFKKFDFSFYFDQINSGWAQALNMARGLGCFCQIAVLTLDRFKSSPSWVLFVFKGGQIMSEGTVHFISNWLTIRDQA